MHEIENLQDSAEHCFELASAQNFLEEDVASQAFELLTANEYDGVLAHGLGVSLQGSCMDLDRIYALATRVEQRLHCSQQKAEYTASLRALEHTVSKIASSCLLISTLSLLV